MRNPRLFAIAGALEGAFFALPAHTVSIGRDPANLISIDDPAIAPHHCELCHAEGEYAVRSRGARAGVFVNGLPAVEKQLSHGDEIRVGGSLFLFLVHESETPWEHRLQVGLERLERENRRLRAEARLEHDMIGASPAMHSVFQAIARVAPAGSTVLLCGESGTGKELAARAIHRNSPRACGPFVPINCAAIQETLLESELFGHERGAFTGAIAQKRGKLEMAGGGTVFFDEIGELALPLQAKLLRVLQEQEFERVGGVRPIRIDVRVLAATNRDLASRVREGLFRQDLYYRLNVVRLTMPPLRERRADIPLLAEAFAVKAAKRCGRIFTGIAPEAVRSLMDYDWPGNVRELENAIERAIVLGSNGRILPEDLPEHVLEAGGDPSPCALPYQEAVNQAKRGIILDALRMAGGNFTVAARALGIHPNNLHRLVRSLRLRHRIG